MDIQLHNFYSSHFTNKSLKSRVSNYPSPMELLCTSGIPRDIFVSPLDEEDHICKLCDKVLNNPFQCGNSHCFCLGCITSSALISCPVVGCTKSFGAGDVVPNAFARRSIVKLITKCQCASMECIYTGTLSEYFTRDCEYMKDVCSNNGCEEMVQRRHRAQHGADCPKRIVSCEHCLRDDSFDQMTLHKPQCDFRPITCACGSTFQHQSRDNHIQDSCPLTPVVCRLARLKQCQVATCTGRVPRGEERDHLESQCNLNTMFRLIEAMETAGVGSKRKAPSETTGNAKSTRFSAQSSSASSAHGTTTSTQPCAPFDVTITYADGTYCGQTNAQGKRHGQGVFTTLEGEEYRGQWDKNKRHGSGMQSFFTSPDVYAIYDGCWQNDKWHGHGELTHADGSTHKGVFCRGVAHGKCKHYYPDSSCYEGQWINEQRVGEGATMSYANGDVFLGDFRGDKRQGQGLFRIHATGNEYDGAWDLDIMTGQGKMTYRNGDVYRGTWLNGLRDGRGLLRRKDGSAYEGVWKEGEMYNDEK